MKNFTFAMKEALEILLLKYNKIQKEYKEVDEIEFRSFFCIDECFEAELLKLSEYYKVDLKLKNPFSHEVVIRLSKECLIDISKSGNNKGSVRITIDGIEKIKEIYKTETINNDELSQVAIQQLQNKSNILIEQIKKRDAFLLEIYKIALAKSPSQPLSYKVGIEDITQYSIEDKKRIITELVQLGYTTSGLGCKFVSITMLGLQNIESKSQIDIKPNEKSDSIKEKLDFFHLKPNIIGIGLNLNKIIETIINFFKKNK